MSLMYSLFGWTGLISPPTPEPTEEIEDDEAGFEWKPNTGDDNSVATAGEIVNVDMADVELKALATASPGELLAPGEGVGVKITPMESIGRGTGEEVLIPKKVDAAAGGTGNTDNSEGTA